MSVILKGNDEGLEERPVPKYNMEQSSVFFFFLDIKNMMKLQLSHLKESKKVIACVSM